MAQTSSLLLLLTLLPLPQHMRVVSQNVQVEVSSVVNGLLGDDVQLPCYLLPGEVDVQVSQVTWLRRDQTKGSLSIAVFHPFHGPGFPSTGPGKKRLAFISRSQGPGSHFHNATLAIQDLRAEDEANYTCEFATFPGGNGKGTTWLRVLAKPRNSAKAREVMSGPAPVTVASCVSSGGRPPPRISWFPPLSNQSNEIRTAGPLPNTFTVTSHLILVPTAQANEETVTCKIEHETLKKPALMPVTLVVKYTPEVSISSYDDDWYIGRKEASLNCDAQSNPKPETYKWSTTSGFLPATAVPHGPKLIITSVDWSVNSTFICEVTNAVGTGWANRTIHVKETSSTNKSLAVPLSPENVVGIVIGVMLGVVML